WLYCNKVLFKETYIRKFPTQIATERAPWLYVENYTGSAKKEPGMSAERLIESWDWLSKIRSTIEKLLDDRPQNPCKNNLPSFIAKMVMESLKAVCSQGQNLVPIGVFEYDLVTPITRSVQAKFIQKLGIDETKMWSSVFNDYVELFDDDEVARLHTHREWWIKCCRRIPFEDLHTESRQQIAHFLTQVVIEACKFPALDKKGTAKMLDAFSLRNVAIEEESRVFEGGRVSLSKMLGINSKLLALLDEHPFDSIVFPTHQLPMTHPFLDVKNHVPPRPWCDGGLGGPEYTRRTLILRNLQEYRQIDINFQMRKRLRSRAQARPVFDALNQLGSTPWRINEPMLEVLCQVFEMSSDSRVGCSPLAIPSEHVFIQEFFGEEIRDAPIDKPKYAEYSKRKAEAIKLRNELNSLWCWMKYRIVLARHFRGQTLFFPHNMDFRGRVYPISPYLSHMGDDVNRCILKFAKGRPLGSRGFLWLKLHCINLTGKMKRDSIKDRLIAADQQLDDMVDSANHPLDGKGWWLESEEPWQTLAACMEIRDQPTIVYVFIILFFSHLAVHQDGSCNGLQHYAALGRDEQGGLEVNLLKSETPNDVYSSLSRRELKMKKLSALQIKRQLKALDIDNEETGKFAQYLTHKTFASLHDAFTCSMKLKDWFRDCAKGVSDLLQTMEWVTPLGNLFTVPCIDRNEGVTFAAVHDCFWTHASTVDEMGELCREQFIRLHSEPIVQQCSDWFHSHYLKGPHIELMSPEDLAYFRKLFTCQVKPGDLDINQVKDSVYFFS
ncbi:unnamed protein product, partial [Haemonchus placei]|uniref:DNA-directed RNA polymerase n=1 Tax=Haemonchus placei TaxID=6290 RepID=A0A0N4WEU1_HAEPC